MGMERGEGGGIESVQGSFERKEGKKKRGAMLCASVTVTPQSIDTTLDSLSLIYIYIYILVGSLYFLFLGERIYIYKDIYIFFFSSYDIIIVTVAVALSKSMNPFHHHFFFVERVYKIKLYKKKSS